MRKVRSLLLVVMAVILTASLGFAADKSYHAKLTGKDEVPSVKTKAKGKVEFKVTKDGKLTYKLSAKNIENATAAHIHRGMKGESGPPIANLFSGPKKEGKFSGVLSEGTITDKDLTGDLQGKTVDDLVKLLDSGAAFVNIHTDLHPDGEIRGQVK